MLNRIQKREVRLLLRLRVHVAITVFLLWPIFHGIAGWSVVQAQELASEPYLSPPVQPLSVTVDMQALEEAPQRGPLTTVPEGEPLPAVMPAIRQPVPDPAVQLDEDQVSSDPDDAFFDPIVDIAGITASANPADTVGDVGTNHYVQMVNATEFKIWNKQGTPLTVTLTFGNLWPIGSICRADTGDPIVVYDHLADRWLLSQFADPRHMCIAISQTPDPTAGSWHLYTFDVGNFPDYPKFGVWPDGYYMSSYEFPDLGIYVFDRTKMLTGNAASFFKSTLPALGNATVRSTRILPSDLDGPEPPAGTPNFFVRTVDDQQDPGSNDRIEIYAARVNWSISLFSFTLAHTLTPAPFQIMLCNRNGGGIRDCIPQPNTASTLDALSNRPMMQLKYRNFGSYEAMIFNQAIDVSASIGLAATNEVAGIRWYELRRSSSTWTIHQQGTYAPQPGNASSESELLHRWMGSMAMDKLGNIALGYSISNDDNANPVYPGIRYTGRRWGDRLGILESEEIIFNGTNPQTDGLGGRWGDYSAMSVDPVDDCTFWYTNHIAAFGSTAGKPTRIASFKFPECGASPIMLGLNRTQGQGWLEAIDPAPPHSHQEWPQISWSTYNNSVGESYPALCDVDGDTKPEVVIGLGPGGDGWFEVKDDEDTGYAPLAWLQIDWLAYNSANGQTRPTCGDLDGDNRDEICIGLGNGANGWFQCFDDASAGYAHLTWQQVDWLSYNSANGETRPALCDVDGDGRAEIVLGLGSGSAGWLQIKNDALSGYANLNWLQVSWPTYNSANGETRPACGNLDHDNPDELVIGLGTGSKGWLEARNDAGNAYAHFGWMQVDWPVYNSANGETYPACGNLDTDNRDEIVIGLGSGGGGWSETKDDATTGYPHISWPRLQWPAYNSANGETRPTIYRSSGGI